MTFDAYTYLFVYLGLTSEVILWRCLLVAVVFWLMCCHTGMPCRHRTWHLDPSNYKDIVIVIVLSIDVERYTGIHIYPFWYLGSDTIGKSFSNLLHTPANTQLYDVDMVVVTQKLGRKCTIITWSWTGDLWCANPLRFPLAHSCFYIYIYPTPGFLSSV